MNTFESIPIAHDSDCCTGCAACAAACPEGAVSMRPDHEGFYRPHINADDCSGCQLCRKICPANQKDISPGGHEGGKEVTPLSVYAAWHMEEAIRFKSSSGGVFTALAENIIAQGGVVVGAAFDDKLVVRHVVVGDIPALERLRGSKYVQSDLASSVYHRVRDILKQNRPVFFTGTPCQIDAIKSFLNGRNAHFFSADIACHGVPSPLLLFHYIQDINARKGRVVQICFRDKTKGWKGFGMRHHLHGNASKFIARHADTYMLSFLRDYALRPSCYKCKYTKISRPGDLTMADFWGVSKGHPEYDLDDKGTSLVLVNTEKGKAWLQSCEKDLFLGKADLATAIEGNPVLVRPSPRPPQRSTFYQDLGTLSFYELVKAYQLYRSPFSHRLASAIIRLIKIVFHSMGKGSPEKGSSK